MATYQKTSAGHVCATVRRKGYPAVSKTFAKKANAKAWATELEELMRTGKYKPADETPLSAVLDRYEKEIVPLKKRDTYYKSIIKKLKEHMGEIPIKDFTANTVIEYVTARRAEVSTETVRKEVNTLNHIIRTAVFVWNTPFEENPVYKAKEILKSSHALRPSKARSRRLADGEEQRLLDALSGAVQPKAIVMLTLETARRLNELMAIRADLVSWRGERPYLQVEDSKTGDAFEVPLSMRAAALLAEIDAKPGERLFTCRNDSVSQSFARAVKRAGLTNLRLTDLRHEALSRLFERGFSVPEVMAVSGHRTPDVLLKVYSQVSSAGISRKLEATA